MLFRAAITLCAFATMAGAEIRGAAVVRTPEPNILTWGTELLLWKPRSADPIVLLKNADFGSGGCVADLDHDGVDEIFVAEKPEPSRLLYLTPPRWDASTVESTTEFRDCLALSLNGKRGVLIPHFHSQLRHYARPAARGGAWQARDVYSIYTASRQSGLHTADVDGDGQTDLFIGNYWLRNPGKPGLHWRLFAINNYYDTIDAASAESALVHLPRRNRPSLVWLESIASPARAVVLHPGPDPRQLWTAEPLPGEWHEPRGLLVHDIDRDGVPEIVIGDRSGVSLLRYREGTWRRTALAQGFVCIGVFAIDGEIYAVRPDGVRVVSPLR